MVWVKKSVAMLLLLGIFLMPQTVYAAEDYMDEMMQELKLDEVDEAVEENVTQLPDKYTFSDCAEFCGGRNRWNQPGSYMRLCI